MTQSDWDQCCEPQKMLKFLCDSGRPGDRKLRLYAAACCRHAPRLAGSPGTKVAHLCERLADGLASPAEALRVRRVSLRWQTAQACAALRDLFNPFHPLLLDASWLTPTVLSLATAAYEHRLLPSGHLDCARLLVLADALLDAGCNDVGLLQHLRGEGPHWRGCFAVDAVLGKS